MAGGFTKEEDSGDGEDDGDGGADKAVQEDGQRLHGCSVH